jgi:hypothetical protein
MSIRPVGIFFNEPLNYPSADTKEIYLQAEQYAFFISNWIASDEPRSLCRVAPIRRAT